MLLSQTEFVVLSSFESDLMIGINASSPAVAFVVSSVDSAGLESGEAAAAATATVVDVDGKEDFHSSLDFSTKEIWLEIMLEEDSSSSFTSLELSSSHIVGCLVAPGGGGGGGGGGGRTPPCGDASTTAITTTNT